MKAKRVTFPRPTLVRKRKPWRCPHGLTSGVTCEGCGRWVSNGVEKSATTLTMGLSGYVIVPVRPLGSTIGTMTHRPENDSDRSATVPQRSTLTGLQGGG